MNQNEPKASSTTFNASRPSYIIAVLIGAALFCVLQVGFAVAAPTGLGNLFRFDRELPQNFPAASAINAGSVVYNSDAGFLAWSDGVEWTNIIPLKADGGVSSVTPSAPSQIGIQVSPTVGDVHVACTSCVNETVMSAWANGTLPVAGGILGAVPLNISPGNNFTFQPEALGFVIKTPGSTISAQTFTILLHNSGSSATVTCSIPCDQAAGTVTLAGPGFSGACAFSGTFTQADELDLETPANTCLTQPVLVGNIEINGDFF